MLEDTEMAVRWMEWDARNNMLLNASCLAVPLTPRAECLCMIEVEDNVVVSRSDLISVSVRALYRSIAPTRNNGYA